MEKKKMRLIDADALPLERYGEEVISWYATGWNDAIDAINRAPAVDAEPVRHGEWGDLCRGKMRICSCCKYDFDNTCNAIDDEWMFCPNCGAKMDKGVKT